MRAEYTKKKQIVFGVFRYIFVCVYFYEDTIELFGTTTVQVCSVNDVRYE